MGNNRSGCHDCTFSDSNSRQDQRTRLRVLDRSGLKIVGVVYEDRATLANLASLRSNKPKEVGGVDPEVEALIRPPSAPAGPPKDKK